jgi:hypothetical protein
MAILAIVRHEKETKKCLINVLVDVLKFPNISNDLVLLVKQFKDLHA